MGLPSGTDSLAPMTGTSRLLCGAITEKVIGGFFHVHRVLGYGHKEVVYQRALAIHLRAQGLRVRTEVMFEVHFQDQLVGRCRVDLLVEEQVVVEVKAAARMAPEWEAQLLSELKASNKRVGLLLFFGPKAAFKRLLGPAPDEADTKSE